MPINKNAYKRFQIIHKYISQGKYPSADFLADKCYVSTDQVKIDIKNLRDEWHAPIVYNKKAEGYYYTDHTFYLPAIFVTERELEALKVIVPFLKPLDGTEVYNTFKKFLKQLYDLAEWEEDEILRDPEEIIDISAAFGDTLVLSKLINAARYLKKIKITYFDGDQQKENVVKPYKVVFEQQNFVLICEKEKDLLLKIDVTTITKVEEQKEVFAKSNMLASRKISEEKSYPENIVFDKMPVSKMIVPESDEKFHINYSIIREEIDITFKQQLLELILELG